MSLLNKIKKYFSGIDSEDSDEQLVIDVSEGETPTASDISVDKDALTRPTDNGSEIDNQKMAAIFQNIIAVFNNSLPGFLKSSVDTKKQEQYLMDSLDASLRDYLKSVEEDAANRGMAAIQNERSEQKKMIETLRQRMLEVEKKRNDLNEQHLSDSRQKRALNERIRDLEKRINELEADREQLNIENKSLVNKIKVANVIEGDVEAMRKEIESLKAKQAADPAIDTARLEQEKKEMSAVIDSLKSEIDRLSQELSKRDEALQTVRMKDEMGDVMLNDLQKRASEANKNLKDTENRIAELTQELALKDAQIEDYRKMSEEKDSRLTQTLDMLADKEALLAESQAKVAEAEENMEAINEIAEQIETFYDLKKRMEERISKLKDEVAVLKEENASLKDTIQQNLLTEARNNKSYQEEIDKLREGYDYDSLER